MSNTQKPQENHHQLLLIIIFAVSMLVLLVIAIVLIAPEIEKDLSKKITEQLENNGITASVKLSGRDVTLSGTVNTTDIQKAQQSTAEICGVHFIDNQLISNDESTSQQIIANTQNPLTKQNPPIKALTQEKIAPHSKEKVVKSSINSRISNSIQNNNITIPKTPPPSSTQAYEKILAAMSHHNDNSLSKTPINDNKQQQKTLFYFDTSNIQFRKNSSTLTNTSKNALIPLVQKLKKSKKTIKITAISKKSELAFQQAKAIQQYLVKQGIKKKQLIIVGKSSHEKNTVMIVEHKN